jgi:DNA transformation protein
LKVEDLSQLPNIGEVLAGKLRRAGVQTYEDLAAMGSIAAVLKIGEADTSACYNMLYALEGALRGVRWHALPKEERRKLKQDFDAAGG